MKVSFLKKLRLVYTMKINGKWKALFKTETHLIEIMEIFKLFKNLLKNEGGVDITALSKADSEFLGTLISQTLSIISLDKYQN